MNNKNIFSLIIIFAVSLCGCNLYKFTNDIAYNYEKTLSGTNNVIISAIKNDAPQLLVDCFSDNHYNNDIAEQIETAIGKIQGNYISHKATNGQNEATDSGKTICVGSGNIIYVTDVNTYTISYITCLRDDYDSKNGAKRFRIR